jgi:hypothetical protein
MTPHFKSATKTTNQMNTSETHNDTYFRSFTEAIDYALDDARSRGYVIDSDSLWREVNMSDHYTKARPNPDETHHFAIALWRESVDKKSGERELKHEKKHLHISVYCFKTSLYNHVYELTHYIN